MQFKSPFTEFIIAKKHSHLLYYLQSSEGGIKLQHLNILDLKEPLQKSECDFLNYITQLPVCLKWIIKQSVNQHRNKMSLSRFSLRSHSSSKCSISFYSSACYNSIYAWIIQLIHLYTKHIMWTNPDWITTVAVKKWLIWTLMSCKITFYHSFTDAVTISVSPL